MHLHALAGLRPGAADVDPARSQVDGDLEGELRNGHGEDYTTVVAERKRVFTLVSSNLACNFSILVLDSNKSCCQSGPPMLLMRPGSSRERWSTQ
jgi:hypothetical protein